MQSCTPGYPLIAQRKPPSFTALSYTLKICPPGAQKALPAPAAGQIVVQSVDGGSCPAGQASPDQLSGAQLLYGLKVQF